MIGGDPTDVAAPLKPWQRALYAAVACIGGLAMVVAAVAQLAALARELRSLPPTIEVMMGTSGLLLMGIAITGFGLLALYPPADLAPRPRSRTQGRPRLDRAQRVVGVALICLVLVPVTTIGLRLGLASYLQDRGYRRQIVDPGFHSRFLTIRWTRDGANS